MVAPVDARRSSPSDAALVERVRAGERDCFAVLVARHEPVVRAVCRRLLGRSGLLDDVVQESAVEALVKLATLRDPDRFGPWLAHR